MVIGKSIFYLLQGKCLRFQLGQSQCWPWLKAVSDTVVGFQGLEATSTAF